MLSSRLANDLNSDLGHSTWSVSEKSALIFSRTSRDRAIEVLCTVQGTTMDRFGGPPINRVTGAGLTPFPSSSSRLGLSRSSCFLSLVLQRILRPPCSHARSPNFHPRLSSH
jgi:hypothetical protein